MFKGSDAVERRGVYYAINDEDHPGVNFTNILWAYLC